MIEKSNIILTGLCAHLLQQVSDFHVIFFTIILIFWRNNPLESIYSIPYIYIWGHGTSNRAKSVTKICYLFPESNSMKSRT